MTCRKTMYRSRDGAAAAARRRPLGLGWWSPYRCRTCRYGDGQRAWHWGHLNRGRAR